MMNNLTREINELRTADPDVAMVVSAYEEIENAYRGVLVAMGYSTQHSFDVRSSAEITISFTPTQLSSE